MAIEENSILPFIEWEENIEEEEQDTETGYLTPLFDFHKRCFVTDSNGRMIYDDGLKGMETIIAKTHATVRDLYVIYSDDYGSDVKKTLKEDVPREIKEMMMMEAIRDSLIYDDRITDISEIELTRIKDAYLAKYIVYTIFGEVEVEREV